MSKQPSFQSSFWLFVFSLLVFGVDLQRLEAQQAYVMPKGFILIHDAQGEPYTGLTLLTGDQYAIAYTARQQFTSLHNDQLIWIDGTGWKYYPDPLSNMTDSWIYLGDPDKNAALQPKWGGYDIYSPCWTCNGGTFETPQFSKSMIFRAFPWPSFQPLTLACNVNDAPGNYADDTPYYIALSPVIYIWFFRESSG